MSRNSCGHTDEVRDYDRISDSLMFISRCFYTKNPRLQAVDSFFANITASRYPEETLGIPFGFKLHSVNC